MLTAIEPITNEVLAMLERLGLPRAEAREGLTILKAAGLRLSFELLEAEAKGVPLRAVVKDGVNYPKARQLHETIKDVLLIEIPSEFASVIRGILVTPTSEACELFRLELARTAASLEAGSPERALARLVLFEAVRLNVLAMTWPGRADMIRYGLDDDGLDRVVEEKLDIMLAHPEDLAGETPPRPLEILVTASLAGILENFGEVLNAFSDVSDELQAVWSRRAKVDQLLADADRRKAVLFRNTIAPVLEEERLTVEMLIADHPLVFDGAPRANIDQMNSRLQRKIIAEGVDALPARKNPSLIDLILALKEEEL